MKVDQMLACFDYLDYEKVSMATYKFTCYALVWWNQFCREIKQGRRRHGPLQQVVSMYQGSKSIEDYHIDMEVALTRANMLESSEATMTHFIHELNVDI
ncbi:hypothetical protein CR513_03285, partial [Mucuna pruriens]